MDDDHCRHLRQAIARHLASLSTDDQRSTFQPIKDILVRTYIPAVVIISNPFDVVTDNVKKRKNQCD